MLQKISQILIPFPQIGQRALGADEHLNIGKPLLVVRRNPLLKILGNRLHLFFGSRVYCQHYPVRDPHRLSAIQTFRHIRTPSRQMNPYWNNTRKHP